jgi:threonine aldolase
VGSIIATNDTSMIDKLRRFRRMYGGAMRQAGIVAAAGIYALEHNIARLKEDHEHARRLAQHLRTLPSVVVDPNRVETNIVVFDIVGHRLSPADIVAALRREGVLINAIGGTAFRAVTHLDVSAQDIDRAGEVFAQVLGR